MRFEHEKMSLWFGTSDAPTPGIDLQAGSEATITIGVSPADASNKVVVLYRVNDGTEISMPTRWIRNNASGDAQYFEAKLGPFRDGDVVSYTAYCNCAGRTVPANESIRESFASFQVKEKIESQLYSESVIKASSTDSPKLHSLLETTSYESPITATVEPSPKNMVLKREETEPSTVAATVANSDLSRTANRIGSIPDPTSEISGVETDKQRPDLPLPEDPILSESLRKTKALEFGQIINLEGDSLAKFVEKDLNLEDANDATLNELVKENIINEKQREDLKLTIDLSQLGGRNTSLINAALKVTR
ncbi:MAG: hypothetical protein AAB116_09435 [Candidatus Poribacteria bacterium]